MISISITKTKYTTTITADGHSTNTDEPCSRVSTTLDLIYYILLPFITSHNRYHGYTSITLINSQISLPQIQTFTLYLYSLQSLYPSNIKITQKENQNENN